MFTLSRPSDTALLGQLAAAANQPLSYEHVGGTQAIDDLQAQPWIGAHNLDDHRVCLGQGGDVFEAARNAIVTWKMFDLPWVTLCWPDARIAEGVTVGVLARAFGMWSFNLCRIVYVVDEQQPDRHTFGFGYGTLPDHVERGEERFAVEHDLRDDTVWYRVSAFSRPNHWLALAGYPLVRRLQRRFARGSLQAMQRATPSG